MGHKNFAKIFSLPGPAQYTRVTFERRDGASGSASLELEGLMRNLWRCDRGGYYTWVELLTQFEPLRGVRS